MNTELILAKVSQHVEVTPTYKNYLKRDILEEFTKEISEDKIVVESKSTIFVNRQIDELIALQAIEEKVSQLRKLAKKKNCKLKGVNKSIKSIRAHYQAYQAEVKQARNTFRLLAEGWYDYEIRQGYSDDIYYEQYLQELEFKLQKMHYMDTFLSQCQAFVRSVEDDIKELQSTINYTVIGVYF